MKQIKRNLSTSGFGLLVNDSNIVVLTRNKKRGGHLKGKKKRDRTRYKEKAQNTRHDVLDRKWITDLVNIGEQRRKRSTRDISFFIWWSGLNPELCIFLCIVHTPTELSSRGVYPRHLLKYALN
ncbi:hypothetical protein MtrunA17_Chr3g0111101 [Medicago truncatula]|uniref:Transmembrane protein, putative n=1 Tax=Medicago truncatula TaxID=3880 RepID=A0A072UXU5_MEDTR|nr:transmembrane protein, putative [Medicago truncatula]RHN68184.1 hypothetical protein MtrunA17_Chr3g0111101 [Medicago truncatula]